MKFFFSLFVFCFISLFAFADKVTFYTGLTTGCTLENPLISYDPYIPLTYIRYSGRCLVTSIRKTEEKDVWCMTLTIEGADGHSAFPVSYDYYLRKGECIYLRRVAAKMGTSTLKVLSVDWNKATFAVDE